MSVALLIAALLVIIALAIANVRLRKRAEELVGLFERSTGDVERIRTEMTGVQERSAAVELERDDAVERVQRARKDAAEVANRLRDETKARAKAEKALKSAAGTVDRAIVDAGTDRAERDAARTERDGVRTELSTRTAELVALRDTLDDARAEAAGAQTELGVVRAELMTIKDDLAAAAASHAATVDALREDLAEARRGAPRSPATSTDADGSTVPPDGGTPDAAPAASDGAGAVGSPEMGSAVAGEDLALVWALTLARVERTWRISVAAGDDAVSPLTGVDDQLRTAVEIEVDAAREEVGADIDLAWEGPGMVPTGAAVTAFSIISHVIATVSKGASRARIDVAVSGRDVDVTVAAEDDDGAPMPVSVPTDLSPSSRLTVTPGQISIPIGA